MITHLYIDGFKSFNDFSMYFTPYTVIAGTNASGKSNLFDAIRLLSQLANGINIHAALRNWRGDENEVFTLFTDSDGNEIRAKKIVIKVDMLVDKEQYDSWGENTELETTRLRYEIELSRGENPERNVIITHEALFPIYKKDDTWAAYYKLDSNGNWLTSNKRPQRKAFLYYDANENREDNWAEIYEAPKQTRKVKVIKSDRSLLSKFDDIAFPHLFAARREMENWHYMQLNPSDLRKPSDTTIGENITSSGRQLASTINRLKKENSYNLISINRLVNEFLPNFIGLDVVPDEDDKRLVLKVKDRNGAEFSSLLLSEGTLRIITLCVLTVDKDFKGLLCFEEPENGIHPFRLYAMANLMHKFTTDLSQSNPYLRQVIVNSHSPLFVELSRGTDKRNSSVNMSRMVTHITTINNKRVKVGATRIIPILEEGQKSIGEISENEAKKAWVSAKDFLYYMSGPNKEEK